MLKRSSGLDNLSKSSDIFQRIDAYDGTISFHEFVVLASETVNNGVIKSSSTEPLAKIQQLWKKFDMDNSGDLDHTELKLF